MICVICQKYLEEVDSKYTQGQPYGGGNIRFIFTYGSCKFDNYSGCTYYDGFICDDCAEPYVKNMKESGTEFN
jgi:hypothetical protein